MKELLSQHGINVIEKNIDDDTEAMQQMLAAGMRTVPSVLAEDGAVWSFRGPDSLQELKQLLGL